MNTEQSSNKAHVRAFSGSWIDFRHPNPKEGDYWNEATLGFSEQEWKAKIREMAAFGIDTVIIGSVMLKGRAFYPSELVPSKWEHACHDPIEAVMTVADELDLTVYAGAGFFSDDTGETEADATEIGLRRNIPLELHKRYGKHPSFRGWYLPVEGAISGTFPEPYIQYVNEMSRFCRAPDAERSILIAPYGTRTVTEKQRFTEQLRTIDADHIAYQDEVGVRKSEPHELPTIFQMLHDCHAAAGRPLWADVEIFTFEGGTYASPLIPAPFDRIRAQIEAIAPFVDKLLCYQYPGLVNAPCSKAFAGHPSSVTLHRDYLHWQRQQA